MENNNFVLNRLGIILMSVRYFALLLKLKDRCSVEFLAFIWPEVQWITWQSFFPPILLPGNARFSRLLVSGKYSCALSQQPTWRLPPYLRQITCASPLHMYKDLSGRGLFTRTFESLCERFIFVVLWHNIHCYVHPKLTCPHFCSHTAYTCLLQIFHLPMIQLRKAWALCPALNPDLLSQAHCC